MKKITLLLFSFIATTMLFAQGTENFDNSEIPGTYSEGSFTGNNNIEWTYVHSRNESDFAIDGAGIMLRRANEPSSLSATIDGGIGTFSVDTRKAFTGNAQRRLELLINGTQVATFEPDYGDGEDATIHTFEVDVDTPGTVNLTLQLYGSTGNQQMVLDNITWTDFSGAASPFLSITSPADGTTFSPNTSEVTVEFAISNFTISSSATETNGDGYVQYSIDGGDTYINQFDAENIVISDLDAGEHTVMIQLVDNDGNDLDPAVEDMITYTIPAVTQVTSITDLRADVDANGVGSYYEITGNSLVTWTDGYNNRRWIQDETISGILIFDQDEVIAGDAYTAGDMVSGLVGYTVDYNGVLQFVPSEDAGTVESSGNTVAPQVITVAEFATNYENYESEYIAFQDVTINDSDDTDADGTFQTGTNYPVVSGTDETEMRTDFYGADYIGEMIPSAPTTITAVAGEFNGNHQIFATNVDATLAADNFTASTFTLYPNPTSNGAIAIQTETSGAVNVEIYNLLGKRALTAKNVNGNLNVSTLNAGVYLVKVTQNGVSSTKKLIVK